MSLQADGNGNNVWKWIAAIEASILTTAVSGWLTFGFDSVKHSQIDAILQIRAPYVHDRQRIQDRLDALDHEVDRARTRLEYLERQVARHNREDK